MTLVLVTAPADEPISLAEAKEHLREDGDGQDGVIALYISAARANAEAFLGRALIDQTWDYYVDAFPTTGGIAIPLPPTIDVIGVFSRDADGVKQEFTDFEVNYTGTNAEVVLAGSASWPTLSSTNDSNAVRIRFRAGYVDGNSPYSDAVPEDIKAAILLTVGNLYANRESVVVGVIAAELPLGVQWLLRPKRVALGMA